MTLQNCYWRLCADDKPILIWPRAESNVARKEDNFLGLLFSMDDLAV